MWRFEHLPCFSSSAHLLFAVFPTSTERFQCSMRPGQSIVAMALPGEGYLTVTAAMLALHEESTPSKCITFGGDTARRVLVHLITSADHHNGVKLGRTLAKTFAWPIPRVSPNHERMSLACYLLAAGALSRIAMVKSIHCMLKPPSSFGGLSSCHNAPPGLQYRMSSPASMKGTAAKMSSMCVAISLRSFSDSL